MTDSEMFPFKVPNAPGSEGYEAERAAEDQQRTSEPTRGESAPEAPVDSDAAASTDAAPIAEPTTPDPAPAPAPGGSPESVLGESWDDSKARLRGHYPDASEGILFCVYKLLQDREANFKDFRDEARTRGIGLSGRSLHSAKVLLGLATPAKRKPKRDVEPEEIDEPDQSPTASVRAAARHSRTEPRRSSRPAAALSSTSPSVEDALRQAVAQIEDAAQAENARLRDAIRAAIETLQDALEG